MPDANARSAKHEPLMRSGAFAPIGGQSPVQVDQRVKSLSGKLYSGPTFKGRLMFTIPRNHKLGHSARCISA